MFDWLFIETPWYWTVLAPIVTSLITLAVCRWAFGRSRKRQAAEESAAAEQHRRDVDQRDRQREHADRLEQMAIDRWRQMGTPHALGLADELERGRDRARRRDGLRDAHGAPDPDDPYWRAQDAALLRSMSSCTFGAGITLPSGRWMSGDEAAAWQQLETEDTP